RFAASPWRRGTAALIRKQPDRLVRFSSHQELVAKRRARRPKPQLPTPISPGIQAPPLLWKACPPWSCSSAGLPRPRAMHYFPVAGRKFKLAFARPPSLTYAFCEQPSTPRYRSRLLSPNTLLPERRLRTLRDGAPGLDTFC